MGLFIIDRTTGLMWLKKPNEAKWSWEDGRRYCMWVSIGGYTDWRLPNVKELRQLFRNKHILNTYKIKEKWDPSYWTFDKSSNENWASPVNFVSGNSYVI